MPDGCPYDPELKTYVMKRVAIAIEEHQKVGARDSWALWDDEMGVYAKDHIVRCDRCREVFRTYLKAQKVSLKELGKNLGMRLYLIMSGFLLALRSRGLKLYQAQAWRPFPIIPAMLCVIITLIG